MRNLSLFLVLLSFGFLNLDANAEIKAYFNQNTGQNYFEPYRKFNRPGDNLEKVLVDQIMSANESIYVAVQEIRLPGVAKALAYQKSLGRDVRVVLENNYNNTIKNFKPKGKGTPDEDDDHDSDRLKDLFKFIDMNNNGKITYQEMSERDAVFILRKAKVDIIDDTHDGSLGSSLMHHKFVVIDRKKVVISSANFTLSGVHGDFTRRTSLGNDNSLMVVDSAEFAQFFSTEFLIMWGGAKARASRFGVNKPFRGVQTTYLSDGTKIKVIFSPTSLKRFWSESTNGLIAKEISSAKKSVQAALFVFSDQKLSNALEGIHSKKAKIDILAEPKFAFREYSEILDMFGLALYNSRCEYEPDNKPWQLPLQQVGIVNNSNRHGDLLHHKYAVIDDKKVIFGSHNWSDAANHKNDEFLVVIESPALAKSFRKEFSRLHSNSEPGIPLWVTDRVLDASNACQKMSY